jgi:hypothetical protein
MHRKRNHFMTIRYVILACLALGGIAVLLFNPLNLHRFDDQRLIKEFYNHREVFEKLRKIITENPRLGPYVSVSNLKDSNLDESQQHQTKDLLSIVHPSLILTIDNDNVVRFIFAKGGVSAISGGWLKGLEYIPGDYRKEGLILTNLDKAGQLSPGVYLRQIEPKWFLVYQRTE